jgi:anti-sigma B factor antagonist
MSQTLVIERIGENHNGHLALRLAGPLVLATMFELQNQLRNASSATTIVDLSGVPYVDSAGLGVLVNSYVSHQKNGRRLILAGVPERVMSLLKMTRVDQLFEIVPDVEVARQVAGR